MLDIFLAHWAELALALIALLDIVVSLTPSKKDDKILGYLRIVLDAFTSRKKRKSK